MSTICYQVHGEEIIIIIKKNPTEGNRHCLLHYVLFNMHFCHEGYFIHLLLPSPK